MRTYHAFRTFRIRTEEYEPDDFFSTSAGKLLVSIAALLENLNVH